MLSRIGIFQLLSPLSLPDVAKLLRPVDVAAGDVVVREGDAGDAAYLIELGTLLVQAGSGDPPKTIARLGPREFFGEMSLTSGQPRSATVRAETAARLWMIGANDFRQLLEQQPALAEAVQQAAELRSRTSQEYAIEHLNLAAMLADRQELRIGRHPDNDVVLDSTVVSARHAVVRRFGDSYELADLGSANGTFLNGAEVRRAELKDGDQIWLADQRLLFDRRELQRVTEPRGIRIDASGLRKVVTKGKNLLQNVSLTVLPGELVAIVGGSGAGKSTLMDALSGVRPATGGQVLYNGGDYYAQRALYRTTLGYVPQDDIIHTELPLRVTLDFAARLRLPGDTTPEERGKAVDRALEELSLTEQAGLRVDKLSGGQRKRASIGVELLTRPRVFYLDEPTSGLDPATDASMMTLMRDLARAGSTVLLTTHATSNVGLCDKIVFLAGGGHLAFAGPPKRALEYFGVEVFDEIYVKLENEGTPEEWAARFRESPEYRAMKADQQRPADSTPAQAAAGASIARPARGLGLWVRQFAVLSRRTAELYVRNPPRMIPLFAQPVIFAALLIALFRTDLFEPGPNNPTSAFQLLFFLSMTAFLFGLLYGVQEIVKEFAIFRRERLVNLAVFPYLLSKTTFLAPVLALAVTVMVAMMWVTDRLPDEGLNVYAPLMITLFVIALVGLAFSLFTSAIAPTSQVATDLLSAWILPQVLLSGAIVAVSEMNTVGRELSNIIALRWGFEALGRAANLLDLFEESQNPVGAALALQYSDSFSRAIWQNWLIMGAFIVAFTAITWLVLRRRTAI
ncbi:MAG: ATP-binding cassette domain-containing protein [Egibacteraceae bacterium]